MKIAYLGPKGTYCYETCIQYTKRKNLQLDMIGYKTISDTIIALVNNEVEEAIVPIENSIQGSVLETVDNLLENENIYIKQEEILNIKHYLLAKEQLGKDYIKEIYSHPQALAQCKNYLKNNYPDVTKQPMPSTAFAAETVSKMENVACIANGECANVYNLKILDQNIQDTKNNQTRFIVLTLKEDTQTDNTKTSILFTTKHKPGALYKILGLFNIFDVNLTKIESRPAKTALGEYIFWVDFEGDAKQESMKVLIQQIQKYCSYFRILGSYKIE